MRKHFAGLSLALCLCLSSLMTGKVLADGEVSLGPRPFFLVNKMSEGPLKDELQSCTDMRFKKTKFSIGHRGASLQFPEHSKESYEAAARMGAGIIECDVTFTKDAELVCRHSQCDLHTTTNILATPLIDRCEDVEPGKKFVPATFNADGSLKTAAKAKCCTSSLTVDEFKSLTAKMDGYNPRATTIDDYLKGTPSFRTDNYASGATVMTHKESIELFKSLGVDMTPELKGVDSIVGFGDSGLTQKTYARKMIQEYKDAGVYAKNVWPQSFNPDDIRQWIKEYPRYGLQAVYLIDSADPAYDALNPPTLQWFVDRRNEGMNIIAPPIPLLLRTNDANKIIPSVWAVRARRAGFDIITWSLERSGRIVEDVLNGSNGYYYASVLDGLHNDGDILTVVDVLARDVGIIGLFSDWPATPTFYANCVGIR